MSAHHYNESLACPACGTDSTVGCIAEFRLHVGLAKKKCRSCKHEIVWCHTTSGKKAPFELDDKGEYVIENGTAFHRGPPPTQLELGAPPAPQRYTSHFANCTDSSKWRGQK